MSGKPKVNLRALPELKNTTDDMISPYLTSLGYQQNHTLTDVRLSLGFTACAVASATFYYDWTAGFEAAKMWTLWAVVVYFALNTALTGWVMLVEGGRVYVGQKDGVKISLASHTEKHSPYYHLKVTTTTASKKPGAAAAVSTVTEKSAFTNWFDANGHFVEKPFKAFLQSTIPALASETKEARALVGEKSKGKAGKKA